MALTDEGGNGMVMPVAPMYGGGANNGFGNGFGGDGWWILLLFLLIGNNGWGGFGGGNIGGFAADGAVDVRRPLLRLLRRDRNGLPVLQT